MERLGPQDASFLYLETPANHNHVGGLAILDPSTAPGGELRFDDLVTLISSRLHLVPRFRQKVVFPPIPIARPVWIDDVHFDIDFHLRRAAIPSPGGRKELVDYVQRVISRPLDRTKPLWEMYLIEGMENGLVSVLTKVHHAMIDGLSGVDIATAVFDFSPVPQVLSPAEWTPEPEPDRTTLTREALRDGVLHPLAGLTTAVGRVLGSPAVAAGDIGSTLGGIRTLLGGGVMAPQSPFNRTIGPNRRFSMVEAPVQTFKDIKNALRGTVNDVVLAVVAGGVHHLFVERGLATKGRLQRSMVPVSVRADHEHSALGNRVSSIFVDLPVGPMSAKGRMRHITRETSFLKESNEAVGAEFLMNIGAWAPPTIHAMAARTASRARFINLVVSNVPGPQIPMYIAGARLLAQYPIMPLAENMGLSIAVTSLAGTMAFGITADWDTLPDIEVLAAGMEGAILELRKAAEQEASRERRKPTRRPGARTARRRPGVEPSA